jgi:phage/conjugal plasmid C-4 type zinc finger TraR family protein
MDGNGQKECDDCGEDIPQARRQAYPSAIRCVTCQASHEGGYFLKR